MAQLTALSHLNHQHSPGVPGFCQANVLGAAPPVTCGFKLAMHLKAIRIHQKRFTPTTQPQMPGVWLTSTHPHQ